MYNLFRQLGLRHVFVVPRPSRVVGLITRKDLLLEVISFTFSLVEIFLYGLFSNCIVFQEDGNTVMAELQSTSVRF